MTITATCVWADLVNTNAAVTTTTRLLFGFGSMRFDSHPTAEWQSNGKGKGKGKGKGRGGSRRWSWGQIRGFEGRKSPSWVQGRNLGRGSGDGVPQKLEHFLKYTTWNLRSGENKRHNLMPLMAFFYCSAHQQCVVSVSCCTMFGILGGMPPLPPPTSAWKVVDLYSASKSLHEASL